MSEAEMQSRYDAAEDAVEREIQQRLPQWLPIALAPKDGTEVLLKVKQRAGARGKCLVGHYMEGGHCIEDHPPIDPGWYFWNGYKFDLASEPTHFCYLPEPPKE